jgi:hypothetical protein
MSNIDKNSSARKTRIEDRKKKEKKARNTSSFRSFFFLEMSSRSLSTLAADYLGRHITVCGDKQKEI